jgi:ADP-heptose:LPS heptosyltransferase
MEWKRQLSLCAAVVTVDSGPMHLADALGVPLVALFGQGRVSLWAPGGKRSCVLHRQDDPEFRAVHPTMSQIAEGQRWMGRISVDEVLAKVGEIDFSGKVDEPNRLAPDCSAN